MSDFYTEQLVKRKTPLNNIIESTFDSGYDTLCFACSDHSVRNHCSGHIDLCGQVSV